MKKQIKRWGKILVISFTSEEVNAYKLRKGDILDLSDMVIERRGDGE
jgi:hypothetical protein